MDYLPMTIRKQKNIALIAHDQKKRELIQWCNEHKDILSKHFLCGTGTTARMITDATNLPVKGYNSGPLGGDQQIGAKSANKTSVADDDASQSITTDSSEDRAAQYHRQHPARIGSDTGVGTHEGKRKGYQDGGRTQ